MRIRWIVVLILIGLMLASTAYAQEDWLTHIVRQIAPQLAALHSQYQPYTPLTGLDQSPRATRDWSPTITPTPPPNCIVQLTMPPRVICAPDV